MANTRIELIQKIENLRKSKIIVYITGDRAPIGARIAEDAVRPMYNHLLKLNKKNKKILDKIDLFIYSRGGDVSVPWRIVTMLREFCNEFNVLIPYKAYSATTMISMGADNIIAGKKAELGPIDPTLEKTTIVGDSAMPPQLISVEDVSSYISFLKERANLNDQEALAKTISLLAEHLTPLTLGSVNRQYSHIRLVAKKLLTSRSKKMDEEKIRAIIEALTEKMYSHGHAIGRKEAKELGLPIEEANEKIERLMWNLYIEYEKLLGLDNPIDVESTLLDKDEELLEKIPLAIIESSECTDIFETNLRLKKIRKLPPSPQINLNLNLGMPPNVDINNLPAQVQQAVQQIIQQISQGLPSLIQEEIRKQSPIVGVEVRSFAGKWVNKK